MGRLLVALVCGQAGDLFEVPGMEPAPVVEPTPSPIPPADGPLPEGVPKATEPPPLLAPKPRPPDLVREQLLLERHALLEQRPSYAVPVTTIVLGALHFMTGAMVALNRLVRGGTVDRTAELSVGAGVAFVGLALAGGGVVWSREIALERATIAERVDQIDRELGW